MTWVTSKAAGAADLAFASEFAAGPHSEWQKRASVSFCQRPFGSDIRKSVRREIMRAPEPGYQESKVLEVAIIQRRPTKWIWQVRSNDGNPIMSGWEKTRQAAQYQGYRALFLLLAATSRTSNDITKA